MLGVSRRPCSPQRSKQFFDGWNEGPKEHRKVCGYDIWVGSNPNFMQTKVHGVIGTAHRSPGFQDGVGGVLILAKCFWASVKDADPNKDVYERLYVVVGGVGDIRCFVTNEDVG